MCREERQCKHWSHSSRQNEPHGLEMEVTGSDPLIYEPRRDRPPPPATANSRPSETAQCRLPTQPGGQRPPLTLTTGKGTWGHSPHPPPHPLHSGTCPFSSSSLTASPSPLLPSLSFFQIVRKVVRQIDPSGPDDTQELEEVISEGPPEDPSEMEADIDSFMTHAKVLPGPRPPRPSLFRGAGPGPPLPLRQPAWASPLTCLPAPPRASRRLRRVPVLSGLPAVSLCDLSCLLSELLSPGGAERKWPAAGPDRGQEGGSDSEAGQPQKGEAVISSPSCGMASLEVTRASVFSAWPGLPLPPPPPTSATVAHFASPSFRQLPPLPA